MYRMKSNVQIFISNILYAFLANVFSLSVSFLTTLALPKVLDIETFGYYQLYLFYLSFAALFQIGWTDGIPLRLGGMQYADIDKSLYIPQFWCMFLFEICVSGIIALIAYRMEDLKRANILVCACFAMIIMCCRWLLIGMMHATGLIKKYAITLFVERFVVLLGMVAVVITGYGEVGYLLRVDLFGKLISLFTGIILCKDMVFGKIAAFGKWWTELICNIKAGYKLTISNFSNTVIVGTFRLIVSWRWDIAKFSKVSLTFSIVNMILQIISSVSTVMISSLRRVNQNRLSDAFLKIRTALLLFSYGCLVFYYPMLKILVIWLPEYSETMRYAAILLPMCASEGKQVLLLNTYMKVLRKESYLLKINILSFVISTSMVLLSVYAVDSMELAMIVLVAVLLLKSALGETYISRLLAVPYKDSIGISLVLSLAFIILNGSSTVGGFYAYAALYCVLFLYKRKEILGIIKEFER